jgi:tetratricopeptide (TPR) repeat protein
LADLEKESLQIASVVVDAKRDETIGTQQVQGNLKKFYELEKDIACGIVQNLGKDCEDMPEAFKRVHTKSLPALSAFSYGLDHFDRQEYDKAREKFQEALDKDPDFDLARTALIATPFSAMLLMTTSQMISNASNSGVSSSAAASSVAASAGGSGLGVTAAVVGGAALVGGGVAAALNNTDYIDGDDDDDVNGNGNVEEAESQFSDVAGNWVGTWTDADGSANETAIVIEQNSSALSGTIYVYGSDCISTGNLSGTVTTDNRLNLTITSGTSRISVDATFDSSTSTITGNHQYETGLCAGDSGDFRMTLNVELPI